MTTTLTVHLAELTATLNDLRQRFRQAARDEVAHAVGEALRQVALTMLGCSPRLPPRHSEYSGWDEAWQDTEEDSWNGGASIPEEISVGDRSVTKTSPLHAAVVAGLWAARWGFVRTRQPLPALAIGLGVGLAAFAGGPTVQALFAAWSAANDLLHYPHADRRQ